MESTVTGRRPFIASLLSALSLPLAAQQAEPYKPKQSDRPEAVEGDEPGFRSIFNGKNLDGWEGDPGYWRVEEGNLVGEITPQTVVKSNTFIIWRGGAPRDFELKADYRITSGGNSGINYRSVVVPDAVTPANKFAMRGYQADIDGRNVYTGQNYEEKGRLFLATRGQMTHIVNGRKPVILASLGDDKQLASTIKDGWNSFHIIARGNVLTHILNGRTMCVVVDDGAPGSAGTPGRMMEGLIGVQVHVGGPMKVEYRGFRLREY
ncbi:MAG TPA: DUF1080 domain-containing protein [Bryobacteraceae bacterium]|nr:DUF1080 domain-containing protein [Bryobacteraceae bacterium]